jgi:hypothetical protein
MPKDSPARSTRKRRCSRRSVRPATESPGCMSWPEKILLTTGILFFLFAFALIAMMLGDIGGGGAPVSRG